MPGWSDCGSWAARWVAETRPAVLGLLCPSNDQSEVDAFVAEAGGLLGLMTRSANAAGLEPTIDPKRGDIGVVELTGGVQVAAIFAGRRWLARIERGFVLTATHIIAAWKV